MLSSNIPKHYEPDFFNVDLNKGLEELLDL